MENDNILEPEESVCTICNDDGECRANKNHPDYEYDPWDGLTYFDCWNYINRRDAKIKKGTILKVKDLIDYKSESGSNTIFHHINQDKTIVDLMGYLTKHKIQACPVVNNIPDGKTDRILGEIGWEEISRNISNILDDPVSKHMIEPNHNMSESMSLLKASTALKKKRIFYIFNNNKEFYATTTPDDFLDYYGEIITPFHYLREIEFILQAILYKLDVHLEEKPTFYDFNKAFLKPEIFDKLPYNRPRKELAKLLGEVNELRNAFFHHRINKINVDQLKELWVELKAIFDALNKK